MKPALSCAARKSSRCALGRANLKDSFALVERGEIFLHNVHIAQYERGNSFQPRSRARAQIALCNRSEIRRLTGRTQQQGLTLVPLKIYFKRGRAKVELALVRGKKQFDKRQALAQRQADRDVDRGPLRSGTGEFACGQPESDALL